MVSESCYLNADCILRPFDCPLAKVQVPRSESTRKYAREGHIDSEGERERTESNEDGELMKSVQRVFKYHVSFRSSEVKDFNEIARGYGRSISIKSQKL